MYELVKTYIGKECILYTLASESQVTGVIREVTDGWVLVENDKGTETVNLDYVARIREYPRKKNGKKQSVVLD